MAQSKKSYSTHKKFLTFGLATFLLCASPAFAEDFPVIRMAIADRVSDCLIGVAGPYRVEGAKTQLLLEGDRLADTRILCSDGRIRMGDTLLPWHRMVLEARQSDIRVAGKSYASRMEIIPRAGDRLTLVSLMDLEEYTQGVLEKEMEPAWPLEALKAQAILARNNAVYAYHNNKGKAFHLTRYSPQVYERNTNLHPNTVAATRATRGRVLMYGENIIPAYYHSACGGGTEAAKNVWQKSGLYPSSAPCDYCKDAPNLHWTSAMPLADFENKLNAAGIRVRQAQNIFAGKISAVSDRITEIVIEHAGGKAIVRTNTLRAILGNDKLRSTNFSVVLRDGEILFSGQGWGHGVGLCQWGARAMAMAGKSCDEIIKFYYPGVRIVEVNEGG